MFKKYLLIASTVFIGSHCHAVDISDVIVDAHNAETLLVSAAHDIENFAKAHSYIIRDVIQVLGKLTRLIGHLPLKIGPISLPGSKELKNSNAEMIRVIAALQSMKVTFDAIESDDLMSKIKEVAVAEITQDIATELNKNNNTPLTEEQLSHISHAVSAAIPALLNMFSDFLKIKA